MGVRCIIFVLYIQFFLAMSVMADSSLINKMTEFAAVPSKRDVWKDQLGGYDTGGSVYTMVPTVDLKLLTVNQPPLSVGCGGIDLFFGGFGYINSEKMDELIKHIGTSRSYASMLAIKSISPQVSDLLEDLEAKVRFVNGQNISSCQLGAGIASGTFMKNEQSQRLACQARKMGNNSAANYFAARYECTDTGKLDEVNSKLGKESLLPSEFNLVWFALQNTGLSREDKEFLMSLTGTLIVRRNQVTGTLSFTNQNSLLYGQELLEALVFGTDDTQERKIYVCDTEEQCLQPTLRMLNIGQKEAVLPRIMGNISLIEKRMLDDTGVDAKKPFSAEENAIIAGTSIPLLKLIMLNAELRGNGTQYAVGDYVESIAFDYTLGYVDSLLDLVYGALANLERSQVDGESINGFKDELRRLKIMIHQKRVQIIEKLNILLSVQQRMRQIEAMVMTSFVEYRNI